MAIFTPFWPQKLNYRAFFWCFLSALMIVCQKISFWSFYCAFGGNITTPEPHYKPEGGGRTESRARGSITKFGCPEINFRGNPVWGKNIGLLMVEVWLLIGTCLQLKLLLIVRVWGRAPLSKKAHFWSKMMFFERKIDGARNTYKLNPAAVKCQRKHFLKQALMNL